jgi:hypothetical protein
MRRIDFLIRQCRRETDNKDVNAISDLEILQYFNDAQRSIQNIVFSANNNADIWTKQKVLLIDSQNTVYALPDDVYAKNAITSVNIMRDNRIIQPLRRVAFREKETLFGYSLVGSNLHLTTSPEAASINKILLNYTARLPKLSLSCGTVDSVDTVANTVTLSGIDLDDFDLEDEYFSFVDDEGVTTAKNLRLINYTSGTTTLEFVGELGQTLDSEGNVDLTGVVAGNKLVIGKDATTHSRLMDDTETFLISYVNMMLFKRDADNDMAVQAAFSVQEREDLIALYADSVKDTLYPPSTDTYYLGY